MIKTNLKELLEKNKLSINKLSMETGLSRPTLTSLLNNDSKGIQFDTLETLLDFFNIPISDFFTITDREILFYFQEVLNFDNLETVENSTIHNSQSGRSPKQNKTILSYSVSNRTGKEIANSKLSFF